MAQSIELHAQDGPHMPARSYPQLWKFRLWSGWVMLFAAVVGLFALSWDIQWHNDVGRDRTLTAPHLFLLGSITVMGIAALVAVLGETIWTRRQPTGVTGDMSTTFAGMFFSSRGTYLVGYGALASAIAFPIDQYWHTLYGIDVTIWAPFHIMVLAGFCMCCLGVADLLATEAALAASHEEKGAAWAGYIGANIALATLMGMFTFLLEPSLKNDGFISLGSLTFTVYPLMFGGLGTFILITALQALPWRMKATSVAIVYIILGLLNFVIIPPLMTLLLDIEHQHVLSDGPNISAVAVVWQYTLIVAAVLLDVMAWVAQRRSWSLSKTRRAIVIAALIGVSLATLCNPMFLSSVQEQSRPSVQVTNQQIDSSNPPPALIPKRSPQLLPGTIILIIAASFPPGLLGIAVGNWFGSSFGASMRRAKE